MPDDIAYLGIAEMTDRFRAGRLSPVDAAEAALARIEVGNRTVRAFAEIDRATALQQAEASALRWRAGTPLGPIDGVPISVKDTLMQKGYPFRGGAETSESTSAPVVDRARESGAVILGVTATPEPGGGPAAVARPEQTRNPWDPRMHSGGSSGGAAAAVAAGMGQAALATDAGGSIRIPSALCGVVGLKPTGGRIPTYPPSVMGTLASPGPITRSVRDASLMLSLLARPDLQGAARPLNPVRPMDSGLQGLRIAVTTTLGYARNVHPEVAAAVVGAARNFERLGARVEDRHPRIGNPIEIFLTLFHAGFAYSMRGLSPEQLDDIGETLRDVVRRGRTISLEDYVAAQEARRTLARQLDDFFADTDLLLMPTVAVPAFTAGRWVPEGFEGNPDSRAWMPFGYPFNLAQMPAITLPCGLTSDPRPLPIGLQIVGPRFSECRMLRAAQAYEAIRRLPMDRPPWPLPAAA